jgi:hypothetical protein
MCALESTAMSRPCGPMEPQRRAARDPPDRVGPVAPAAGVDHQAVVHRHVPHVVEADAERADTPTAAAAANGEVRLGERIDEPSEVHVELDRTSHDGPPSSELVERQVHALARDRPERGLQPLAGHEGREILVRASGCHQQRAVRTVVATVDCASHQVQEVALARREPLSEDPSRLARTERPA